MAWNVLRMGSARARKIGTNEKRILCCGQRSHVGHIRAPLAILKEVVLDIRRVKRRNHQTILLEKTPDCLKSLRTGKVSDDGYESILGFKSFHPLKQLPVSYTHLTLPTS